jgi:putative exporter of polyketide antibiotics
MVEKVKPFALIVQILITLALTAAGFFGYNKRDIQG